MLSAIPLRTIRYWGFPLLNLTPKESPRAKRWMPRYSRDIGGSTNGFYVIQRYQIQTTKLALELVTAGFENGAGNVRESILYQQ